MIQRFVPADLVWEGGERKSWRVWDRLRHRFLNVAPSDEGEAWEIAESLNLLAERDFADGAEFQAYLDTLPADPGRRRCLDCHGALHTVARCPFRRGGAS